MSRAPGADELRMRYLLRRRGVGPDALPVAPAPPDAPPTVHLTPARVVPQPGRAGRPIGGPRLPAPGEYVDLTAPAPAEEDEPEEDDVRGEDELEDDNEQEDGAEAEAENARIFWRRVSKAKPSGKGGARRSSVRSRAQDAKDDRRLRIIAFNVTAALPGLALGLVPVFGAVLPAAEESATGFLAAGLAVVGACSSWQLVKQPAVRFILFHPVLQLGVIALAAEIGRRSAPLAVTWIAEHGTRWGLAPSAVSLLVTVLAMCGGLYWLIDRRARAWHWTARLVVRIPLASALLATALHTTGAVS